MSTLKDKVVIVTGGSSGIGRAAAQRFTEAGAKVIITGRRAAALEEAAGYHPGIFALVADAAAPDDAARSVAEAVDAHGRLDVLVNNAGAGAILPLAGATAERIESIFAVKVDEGVLRIACEDGFAAFVVIRFAKALAEDENLIPRSRQPAAPVVPDDMATFRS